MSDGPFTIHNLPPPAVLKPGETTVFRAFIVNKKTGAFSQRGDEWDSLLHAMQYVEKHPEKSWAYINEYDVADERVVRKYGLYTMWCVVPL